ncbi:MAG: phytanoyl-CoA dioxygenase family protein [Archangium sp.]|nr:phytanoyl-CoA dioxygenase family protein [Archangium sp.]
MNTDIDGIRFQREGYLLVRGVFSQHEIEQLRSAVTEAAHDAKRKGTVLKSHTGEIASVADVASMAGLDHLLFDTRIVSFARTLLGTDQPVYFGDSGIMVGGALRGFHKDNTCRDDGRHIDWLSPYGLLRMGIYLQDHKNFSGGLKIRVGSHQYPDVTTGRILAVPSEPGDVVIWNMRTTHSGHAARLRGLPTLGVQPRFEFRLPPVMLLPEPCERLAVFLTYARRGVHLDAYLDKHRKLDEYPNNYLYQSWLHSPGGPSMHQRAKAAGVEFIEPVPDYGSLFTNPPAYPLGYVPTGSSRPDVYPAKGLERVINVIGRATRSIPALGRWADRRREH